MTYEDFCLALNAASASESREYDPDAFPGSAQWRKCNVFTRQIRELEEANPALWNQRQAADEVARRTKIEADYNALSDFVKDGS